MAYNKGEIVLSLKGHDAGQLFCVVNAQDGFVWIVDGKGRKLAAPKRKREKHLQGVGASAHPAVLGLQRGESVTARSILQALAAFLVSDSDH